LIWAWVDKTVITLTALDALLRDSFDIRRVLVVAPLRVARDTWPDELRKWEHLAGLTYSVAVGSESERLDALRRTADLHIINRENVQWLIEQSGLPFDYDCVVIDELSSFKNHQAKRFRALMKVRPRVRRIIGLTGTPSSNGLMDLWAQFRILDFGKRLGRFIGKFREEYFTPDKGNGQMVFSYKPKPDAERKIYGLIDDITVSMKADDHLAVPELVSVEKTVQLSDLEWRIYDKLKRDLVLELTDDGEITAANAAALAGKLAQLANGAVYDDSGAFHAVHSRKLDALEDLIEAANGKPLLVAYWFQHDLQRIHERLQTLHIPHVRLDDSASIERWNRGEIPVALIHPASAGHGLNLQHGGSAIVWFGLTWSLELYQQTNARLWRQGQPAETVVIHHIVTANTIDERILRALSEKDRTQSALIDAVKAEI
jgi:SNF2 family DNA or RNA helicase